MLYEKNKEILFVSIFDFSIFFTTFFFLTLKSKRKKLIVFKLFFSKIQFFFIEFEKKSKMLAILVVFLIGIKKTK
jgi:hypothetical protein